MELREATVDDGAGIRDVARDSLRRSYGHVLDEAVIEAAIEEWYDEGLAADLANDDAIYLVADVDGGIAGFAQAYLVGEDAGIGEIAWLHVSPSHRGERVGARLLAETEAALADGGATEFVGRVLAANEEGGAFYEEHGYTETDERTVRVGDESFDERSFVKLPGAEEATTVPLAERTVEGGTTVYVAFDEADRASQAPLYVAYLDENRGERYGWYCGACGSVDIAMDSMGRAECNNCGNTRKPTRWDASYL